MGGGELIKEDLQAVAVGGGQFQDEVLARVGLHGPTQPEALEGLLEGTPRLDPAQGQAAAGDGVQPKAALVLGPQAKVLARMGPLHASQFLLQSGVAEGGKLVFFLLAWLGRATCRPAPRWVCTQR